MTGDHHEPDAPGTRSNSPAAEPLTETAARRRTLLAGLVIGGQSLMAMLLGVPALLSFFSPARAQRQGDPWRRVGLLEAFPVGEVRPATIRMNRGDWSRSLEERSVYVWRQGDAVVVFSRSCTDLGCPVVYDAGSACFFCPCHGGIFDQQGVRLAGPPQRPLDRYAVRIRDGAIEIDLDSTPLAS